MFASYIQPAILSTVFAKRFLAKEHFEPQRSKVRFLKFALKFDLRFVRGVIGMLDKMRMLCEKKRCRTKEKVRRFFSRVQCARLLRAQHVFVGSAAYSRACNRVCVRWKPFGCVLPNTARNRIQQMKKRPSAVRNTHGSTAIAQFGKLGILHWLDLGLLGDAFVRSRMLIADSTFDL